MIGGVNVAMFSVVKKECGHIHKTHVSCMNA